MAKNGGRTQKLPFKYFFSLNNFTMKFLKVLYYK